MLCDTVVQGREVEVALAAEGDSVVAEGVSAVAAEGVSAVAGEDPLKVLAVGEEEEEAAVVCEAESKSSLSPIVTKASVCTPFLSDVLCIIFVGPKLRAGVFIARGKEDALVTKNMIPGDSVYGEKRIAIEVFPCAAHVLSNQNHHSLAFV